ncbi:MAG: hypothetical protein AAF074_13900 [Pseudomonadota bacterium]
MTVQFRFERAFDARVWEVAAPAMPTRLLTWKLAEDPVDAGPPEAVAAPLAAALAGLGRVVFAEKEPANDQAVFGAIRLPGILGATTALVLADEAAGVRGAFEATGHDWSQAAQWIVVLERSAPASEALTAFIQSLYADWEIPATWPNAVVAVVKAGVDGDAAGITARSEDVLDRLEAALAPA